MCVRKICFPVYKKLLKVKYEINKVLFRLCVCLLTGTPSISWCRVVCPTVSWSSLAWSTCTSKCNFIWLPSKLLNGLVVPGSVRTPQNCKILHHQNLEFSYGAISCLHLYSLVCVFEASMFPTGL